MLWFVVWAALFCSITSVLTITQVYQPCVLVSSQDQYVREGTVVDCECGDLNQTTEEIFWQSAKFGILARNDVLGGNVARLRLTLNKTYDGDVIQCRSQNGTMSLMAGDFPIMVAYGPRSVTLTTNNFSIVLDNCPVCNRTLRVTCLPQDYSPNASIAIYKNGINVYNGTNTTASIPVSSGGSLPVTCEARNGVFADIVSRTETIVEIREIPPAAPEMFVDGRNTDPVTVRENENITILCRIYGGYPQVDETTVQCGHLQPVSRSDSLVIYSLHVSKDLNGANCTCSGSHVTKAYNRTTNLVLNVQYAAEINSFTVDDHARSVEISHKSLVNFSCQADGNPLPYMVITSDNGTTSLAAGSSPLNFSANLSCDDTAVYACLANNSVGVLDIADVNVTVGCVNESPGSPHQDIVPIIVGVVVPAAIITIAIIVIVFIFRCKASRSNQPEPDLLTPSGLPRNDYANIGPGGPRQSGSYNDPARDSQVTMNPYESLCPGTTLDKYASDSREEHTPVCIPLTDHILGIAEEEQIDISLNQPSEDTIRTVPTITCTAHVVESSNEIIPKVPGTTSTKNIQDSGTEIIPKVPGTTNTTNTKDSVIEIIPKVPGTSSTKDTKDSGTEIIPIVPGTSSTKNIKDSGIEIIPIIPPGTSTQTMEESHLVNLRNKPPTLPKKTRRPKLEPADSLSRDTALYKVPPASPGGAS